MGTEASKEEFVKQVIAAAYGFAEWRTLLNFNNFKPESAYEDEINNVCVLLDSFAESRALAARLSGLGEAFNIVSKGIADEQIVYELSKTIHEVQRQLAERQAAERKP